MQKFFLKGGKETFDWCVVMAVAATAQTALHPLIAQQLLIGVAGVLAALIAVMQHTR